MVVTRQLVRGLLSRRARHLSTSAGSRLEGIVMPDHLKESFLTPTPPGRCMAVANPFWAYPIAVVGDSDKASQVAPLIAAIRNEAPHKPIRIITHEDDSGRVFNASFFEDRDTLDGFLKWYGENALSPSGAHHHCLKSAAAEQDAPLPTPETLIFQTGTRILADTRFGEYQLGMAVRYTAWQSRSPEAFEEAAAGTAADEFEDRIAELMQEHGVAYFGRLLMTDIAEGETGAGTILSAVRYGSLDDAKRGSALNREYLDSELSRWFEAAPPTVVGTALRVLEV
jgi:hypothetical protein